MRIAFLGNFEPQHSTESHIAASFELLGHEVVRIQEGATPSLEVPKHVIGCDLFAWTQTFSLAEQGGTGEERFTMLEMIRDMGVPSIGLHLDRWWDLNREHQIHTEAFFRVDHLFTADGGNDHRFTEAGITHHWMPPAIFEPEAVKGTPQRELISDLAFVGNWKGEYHKESRHRFELIRWLRRNYGRRIKFWPINRSNRVGYTGVSSIRGKDLSDLYASVKIVIGDSCLVGTGLNARYISDRIPETLGRGGFLIHPVVEGVTDGPHPMYLNGVDLATWEAFDWKMLKSQIDNYLSVPPQRAWIAETGQDCVRAYHTYTARMREVLDLLKTEGVIG